MSEALWILVAFAVGVIFGRVSARGGSRAAEPLAPAALAPSHPLRPVPQVYGDTQGAYRLMLLPGGPNKINTIKAIRVVVRVDLKTAKDLTDGAPVELLRTGTAEQARTLAAVFQGVAPVRIEGPEGALKDGTL